MEGRSPLLLQDLQRGRVLHPGGELRRQTARLLLRLSKRSPYRSQKGEKAVCS